MQEERLKSLDSIRGVAALGVAIFWHYQIFTPSGYPFSRKAYWVYNYGFSLVDLFFVLSGFIFCYMYKKRIIESRLSFEKYMKLRFCRLYPLMFITLNVVLIIQTIRFFIVGNFLQYKFNDGYHFLLNIFCLQSIGLESGFSFNAPTWSISCEILVYIIFYYILRKFGLSKIKYVLYALIILVGITIIKMDINIPFFNGNTSRAFIGFFIGCYSYEINRKIAKNKYKNKIVFIASITLIITLGNTMYFGHSILGNWLIVYSMFFYPMIILLILNLDYFSKILSFKPFVYIGEISFSIYLWHFPIQLIIKTLDDVLALNIDYSTRFFMLIYTLIVIIISSLSYEFLEKTINNNLRRKFQLVNSVD